ncbi:TetR/AcrR family transcriptional regulator [Nocardioides sp. AN3]
MDNATRWKQEIKKLPIEDRKRDIVLAAARLFHRTGFHNTSMRDIAEEAGLAKGSIYHYFKRKDEILYFVLEEWVAMLSDRHDARVDEGANPSELIEGVISDIFELMAEHRGHVAAFFESYRDLADQDRSVVRDHRLIYRAKIEEAFRRGIKSGEFKEVDVKLATLALFGMCNWAYRWYTPDGPYSAKHVASQFWLLFRDGVGP